MFEFHVDENVKLMLPLPHHAEEIYAEVRDNLEHLKPWMPWATDDYSLESAQFYIKNNLEQLAAGSGFATSIVYENKIVGQIGFHQLNSTNKSVCIGYWIAENMQRKGIVTRCCRVYIDYAFDELELNRVQINCNVENTKSRRIPERLGFQLEGIHLQVERLGNRFGDWAVYGMLKEDWRKQ